MDLRPVSPQFPDARRLAEYLNDLQRRMGDGWALAGSVDAVAPSLICRRPHRRAAAL